MTKPGLHGIVQSRSLSCAVNAKVKEPTHRLALQKGGRG